MEQEGLSIQYEQESVNQPEKRGGAMLFCIGQREYLLIGGANRLKEFNDVWKLSINSENKTEQNQIVYKCKWEQIIQQGASVYTTRNGAQGCLLTNKNQVIVYGGQNFVDAKQYNELLSYSIDKNQWEVLTDDDTPNGRNSHGFIYVEEKQSIYIFGGADQNGPLNDVYQLTLQENDSRNWQKLVTQGQGPEGIEMHTVHYYKGSLLVVGGRTLNGISDKIYQLDLESRVWQEYKKLPYKCCAHGSILIGDNIYIYNGTDGETFHDKLIILNLVQKNFVQSNFMEDFQKNREMQAGSIASSLAYDSSSNEILVFGGCSYEDELNNVLIIPCSYYSYENHCIKYKNQI